MSRIVVHGLIIVAVILASVAWGIVCIIAHLRCHHPDTAGQALTWRHGVTAAIIAAIALVRVWISDRRRSADRIIIALAAILTAAALPAAATGAAAPESSLDDDIRRLAPDRAYVAIAWTGRESNLAVGGDWDLTSWTGVGVEYRRFASVIERETLTGHALGIRGYATPLRVGRLALLTEAGIGAASDIDLTVSPVPVAGIRAGILWDISARIQARMVAGILYTGEARLPRGRIRQGWHPEAAVAVAIRIDDDILALIRRYRP